MTTVPRLRLTLPPSPSDEHAIGIHTSIGRGSKHPMQSLDIQGFSYEERQGILPSLTSAFADCGGWILNRKTLSPTTMEFRVEIQLRAVIDLYASIIASGLELTRAGHLGFTHLCTCRKNLTAPSELGQIVTIRLEISFLEDATLQSLFLSAGDRA